MKRTTYDIWDYPIRETVLDNGFTVLSMKCDIYNVYNSLVINAGSYDDERPGTAHFLEHMVTSGPNRGNIQPYLKKSIYSGSYNNAHTCGNYTCYELNGPSENWKEMLEALFKQVSILHVDEKKVEEEKGVVLQEIRDREAEDLGEMRVNYHLYPHAENICNMTGGNLESVQRINVQDLIFFYKKYYTADNSALLFIGPIDHDEIVKKIQECSQKLSRGALNPFTKVAPILKDGTICDPYCNEKLKFVFHDSYNTKENVALRYAYNLLSNVHFGTLYKRLRNYENLVYHVDFEQACVPLESFIEIASLEENFKKIEEIVFEEIGKMHNSKIEDEAFDYIQLMERINIKSMAENNTAMDRMDYLLTRYSDRDFADYRSVIANITKQDVVDVARKYLRRDKCAVLKILPEV